ncbi:Dam family site-specific DNA-(adenine-N6)-methyltransferase [Legionella bononiensis]|uniref:Site-specific DNA-methyltransferase (adenine-specific) n=1 Tax=Legionella bononiensis TaxID=2793102 RepID=A0ABS1WAF9_9GAMM|nr:Dam family site-specific DNA-(adenine-N6)-methyltransferase [Legionella bononiensis]MBL7480425.1 Dam family site-specific DNA-(adenine-N6)-methyltransferase [Legionella bononiensis]MBL7526342.1 Dam family site-specific DNA-(adenine-N6)-methyltransferase [Legionella bononiensis]MBL7563165.1 Dam family site-specific DNA-(adenine-N6)-methyltransferase [Legionella bononiensis]
MTKIRPFLKWAGSKYNCLDQVIHSLPSGRRLIEPFSGSGVIFMNTNYSSYVLAESNPDLVHLFTTLQKKGELFIEYCRNYFKPEMNCKEKYYELREDFNKLNNSQKKSAMFLYLNRHGYNGLCRYNSKGIYNVPFGLYTKPYFPYEEMLLFHKKSIQAHFIHNDFRKTFELAEKGDVIYCDPPYVPVTDYTKPLPYTQRKFSNDDQIELAELARETASRGIPVIISNHDTEFTRKQYQEAQIRSFPVSRWINCQSNLRQPVNELIAVFK